MAHATPHTVEPKRVGRSGHAVLLDGATPKPPDLPTVVIAPPVPPEIPRCVCGAKLRSAARLQPGDLIRDLAAERMCPRGSGIGADGGRIDGCGAKLGIIYKDQMSRLLTILAKSGEVESGVVFRHAEDHPRFLQPGTMLYIIGGKAKIAT